MDSRGWLREQFASGTRERALSVVATLVLAALPLWLARAHWRARWPWGGDAVSMVLPTALARRALANGQLPVWSPLYFQGESLLNPHSQVLYPPWWLTALPDHLGTGLDIVLGLHFVAAPLVAYWYARRANLPVVVAFGIGAAAAMPLAGLSWHHQKTLGWPWLLLVAGQLLPWEWESGRRAGVVVGVAGGAMLLASSLYYAWYAAVLVAPFFLLYRERDRWVGAITGTLVGLPAIVFNVLPYLDSPRPEPGWWLTPETLLAGLVGFGPRERTLVEGFQVSGVPFEGYAVVGVGVVILGATGLAAAVHDGRRRWVAGVVAAGSAGLVFATNPLVYELPLVGTFRTAGRANVVLALLALVLTIYACRVLLTRDVSVPVPAVASRLGVASSRQFLTVALAVVLLVNAGLGALAWQAMDPGSGTDLAESRAFAASLPDDCGDAVWVEMYTANASMPRGHLGMALLQAGYELDAVYYAAIGASYQVRTPEGALTFDLLLAPSRLNGSTPLTGGSAQRVRGTVNRSELTHLGERNYRGETVHVYAPRGACESVA